MAIRMSLILVSINVVAIIMASSMVAKAQLGGLIGGLIGSTTNINGIVFCTPDGNIGINGTATPAFPNALVQLQCGGRVVSSTTTNASGVFSFLLDPVQQIVSSLLTSCSVVVKTPLATCNVNLPAAGVLQAPLKYAGDTLVGLLKILNVVPDLFNFIPILPNN
ncbi:hypothetical protein M9H77_36821 [Catharanthus roseus]|uniref:Uncharacterized protein n=1 Tax=Catharanthus roseus TaxID=4058 RepID=A0ACB9ZVH3_CATRO|nr:hypothetical protein M9H77_36821 [Catharanthus roseus]